MVSRRSLLLTIFISGMSTLAIEFTTSRLIQTVYGTSNIVWANVIGMVLLFLTLGYFLGGRLADRYPTEKAFYSLVLAAGMAATVCLLATSFILRFASSAIAALNGGAVVGSLLLVILALAVPITLLGCISPFAIRLGITDVAEAGRLSGQIYALSTLGSLAGTYLPVLFLIPMAGSRLTALIFGSLLILTGLWGLWGKSVGLSVFGLFLLGVSIAAYAIWGGPIKISDEQIFETESQYNYIQVIQRDGCNYLLLNEGQAAHSFKCEGGRIPYVSVWSAMLAAPYFNADFEPPKRAAVIGLAGGTVPEQFLRVFPEMEIDGIEIDPEIIEIGREYFSLDDPRINSIAADGRFGLTLLDGEYDVITIDAYRVPYIPWHMTTLEFFEDVKVQLSSEGVVAINVGRVPEDRRLIEALTATMLEVFPAVYTVDIPGTLNTILYAPNNPDGAGFEALSSHFGELDATTDPLITQTLLVAINNHQPTIAGEIVFTDNRAPVETIVDSLVIRYLIRSGLGGLPTPIN